ncbi:hypothetical protein V8E51_017705 [Hyaloscypha variabilis]
MKLLLSLTALFLATNTVLAGDCAYADSPGMSCYNSCSLSFVEALPFTSCDGESFSGITATTPVTAPACFCTLYSGNLGCLNKCCDAPDASTTLYIESSILANYCGGPAVAAMPTAAASSTAADTPARVTSLGGVATATATKKPNAGSNLTPATFFLGGILASGLFVVGLWM